MQNPVIYIFDFYNLHKVNVNQVINTKLHYYFYDNIINNLMYC